MQARQLLADVLGPAPLLAALAPRGPRFERAAVDPVVTMGDWRVAHLCSQALFERLVLRRLRGEVSLDSGQPRVGLVEGLRRQEVGDLSAVRELLRLAQVVTELVQAVARMRHVDRERFSRDHELAPVNDVVGLVAHEVALARDHGCPDERVDLLRADRAVRRRRRRRRIRAVKLVHVGTREGPTQELRALLDCFRQHREPPALSIQRFGLEAEPVGLDPGTPFGRVGRDSGLRALSRDRRDLVVRAATLGDRLVGIGVRDAGVRHRRDLFVGDLCDPDAVSTLSRHCTLSITLVGCAGSSGGNPHHHPRKAVV